MRTLKDYTIAVACVFIALGIRAGLTPWLGTQAPLLIFVVAVGVVTSFGGRGPGLFATALSVVVGVWFLVPPTHSFFIPAFSDGTRVAIFTVAGVLLSILGGALRESRRGEQAQATALRRSNERLRLALEARRMGTLDLDALTGRGIYSPTNLALLGYAPTHSGEGTADLWLDRLHAEDRARVVDAFESAKINRDSFTIEFRIVRADDAAVVWLSAFWRFIGGQAGEGAHFVGVFFDITERKVREERLSQSESTLRSFYESSPLLMGLVELPEDDSDILHLYDSPAVEAFFGLDPGSTRGRRAREMGLAGEAIGRWIAHYRRSQREAAPVRFEYPHSRDGDTCWLSCVVTCVGKSTAGWTRFSYVSEDVTERWTAQAAVRQSEERLALALEAGQLGSWDWDIPSGKVHYGGRWAAMLGYEPAEIEPHISAWERLVHPDEKATLSALLTKHFESRIPFYESEHRLRHKNGSWRWILSRGRVVETDSQGRSLRAIGTHTDITERKTAEAALAAAMEQAEAASQAKDHFLAVLSHELRNPLNPVLLTAGEMLADPALSGTAREAWSLVQKNVTLEALLIDDLLDLTRIVRGKMLLNFVEIDAHSTLGDALQTVRPGVLEKNLRVTTQWLAGDARVRADGARLQQVFWNVLSNAIKFTPPGGSIVVTTRNGPEGRLAVEIADSGIGMSAQELACLFDAFIQGDHGSAGGSHRFGGLGLGMSITRLLLERHSGSIHAQSGGTGQGSTFHIDLPLVSAAPHAAPQPQSAPAALRLPCEGLFRRPVRLLFVEDHESTRIALARMLTRRGFEVCPAGSVAEALHFCARQPFDAVLSDLGLPDGDGYALMAALRERIDPNFPGIAISGYGTAQDIERSRQAGFSAHLTKPVEMSALEAALDRLCDQ